MAAVAYSKGKRGLFFLLTVLCLVGLASSRKDLDNIKAQIQKTEDNLYQLKAKKDVSSTIMRQAEQMMAAAEQMMAAAEKVFSEESDNDDLPLKKLFQSVLHSFDEAKAYLAAEDKVSDAKIANIKLELEKNKLLVQTLEEYQSDNFKAQIQKTEENINQLKAEKDVSSTSMRQAEQMMAAAEQMKAVAKKLLSQVSDNDDLPLEKLFQSVLHSFDTTKADFAAEEEVFEAKNANIKLDLEKKEQLVHEEHHSEL